MGPVLSGSTVAHKPFPVKVHCDDSSPVRFCKLHFTFYSWQSTGQGMEVKLETGLVSTHAYSINNIGQVKVSAVSAPHLGCLIVDGMFEVKK